MDFLNLSLGELLGLAGVISAGIVALYLLDRTKRRQVVATLRFWTAGHLPDELKHKRRIHQPLSLVLQVISLLLLLLAIAGPRFSGVSAARDHVLLLDTSAWMGARARQGILLDQGKAAALAYINSLPSSDRVMLVRADALATPVTAFESDHKVVAEAIRQSQPSTSALNLEQAFEFARQAQKLQSQQAGEIVFAGAGRIPRQDADVAPPPNLRMLTIPSAGENVGLRRLGLRRGTGSDDTWEAFVGLRNDGANPREIALALMLNGTQVGAKTMTLAAGAESQQTFTFHSKIGGTLEARIRSTNGRGDAFPQDDRAAIELPIGKMLRVAVYSPEPNLLKPLIAASPQVEASFELPTNYKPDAADDIMVFDRFAPQELPHTAASIWIEPPATGSPFSVRSMAEKAKLSRWRQETPLAAGLYTTDIELASAEVFNLSAGDQPVAETQQGPVVVARPGAAKMAALGFHPAKSAMKYDLAAPLLMANILRWMAPEIFRRSDVQAGSVGTVNVALESGVDPNNVKVLDGNQRPLPFTIEDRNLRFFAGAPGTVRVITGERETVYSLSLPDVGEMPWQAPAGVARGIPRTSTASAAPTTWWPWLALLGGIGLLIDWLLYGRSRIVRLNPRRASAGIAEKLPWRKAS
jgi:hypothetical protein